MNLTSKPETLVVMRDGLIDDEYYDQIYQAKRRAALAAAKRELAHNLIGLPYKLGKGIVSIINYSLEHN